MVKKLNIPSDPTKKTLNDTERISFEDLFNLDDIQRLQDEFAEATGVASIITHTDGIPITAPSNFCRLCMNIIRKTDKGLKNCFKSDAEVGRFNPEGSIIQQCLSGGLWDAGAGITVGGQHIANWLIGQVRDESQSEENMIKYAQEIGADEQTFIEAFREVPSMSREQFGKIAQMLFTLANQLSTIAYQNMRQARFIAERKGAEKKIKEAHDFTNNIIESSLDAIIVTDSQGVIIRTNKAYQEMVGFSEKELLGKHTAEMSPCEEGPYESTTGEILQINEAFLLSGAAMIEELFEKKHIYSWKVYLLRKDRKVVPVEESLVLLNDINGENIGAVGIIRNITERKQFEDNLRQSQKMEAVGTLAGGIAHDFNNILGGIVGYAELAQDDLSTNNPVQEYIDGILKSSTRARDLVKQILAFSRKSQEGRKPVLVYPIIKEVAKLLRSTTPTTIEIKSNIDESHDMANADPTQIHQIVMNLCTNAVHSMQETGGVLGIYLTCMDLEDDNKEGFQDLLPGPYVKLVISDTGSGIDSDILTHIFEPFFTTKAKEKGTGMGLSVVHGIVKSYGGDIIVKSQIGQGSTFTVLLPQVDAEPEKQENIAVTITKGTERILFIDDEKTLLDIGKKMLQSLGYAVTTKRSSFEALETFQQSPDKFDVVITDQTMPHMTGYDLAKKVLEIKPNVPIILCTGYSDTVTPEKIESDGIKALIYKPISKKEIARTIREVLDKHNLE